MNRPFQNEDFNRLINWARDFGSMSRAETTQFLTRQNFEDKTMFLKLSRCDALRDYPTTTTTITTVAAVEREDGETIMPVSPTTTGSPIENEGKERPKRKVATKVENEKENEEESTSDSDNEPRIQRKYRKKAPNAIDNVKDMLIKYAYRSSRVFREPLEGSEAVYPVKQVEDINLNQDRIAKFTADIKKSIFEINKNDVNSVQHRYIIASRLKSLAGLMGTNINGKLKLGKAFYEYLENNFGIGQRSFQYYKQYHAFLFDYPRFKYAPIPFKELRPNIPKIKQWFYSDACVNLLPTNPLSEAFWQTVPSISHVVSQQMDHDDIKRYYDAGKDGQPDLPEIERVTRVTGNIFVKKYKKPVIEEDTESENDEEMVDSFSMTSIQNSISEATGSPPMSVGQPSRLREVSDYSEGSNSDSSSKSITVKKKQTLENMKLLMLSKYFDAIHEKVLSSTGRQRKNYQFVFDNFAQTPAVLEYPNKSVKKYMKNLYQEYLSDIT